MKIFFSDLDKQPSNHIDVDAGVLDLSVSLALVGHGAWFSYGDNINTNFLRLLERSSYELPPLNDTEGEIWHNPQTDTHYVSTVSVQYRPALPADPPSIPFPLPEQLESREWVGIGEPIFSTAPPASSDVLWFDTNDNLLKINHSGSWTSVAERYLPLKGGTMSGTLTVQGTLTSPILSASGTTLSRDAVVENVRLDHSLFSPTIVSSNGTGTISPSAITVLGPDSYTADIWSSDNNLLIESASSISLFVDGLSILDVTGTGVATKGILRLGNNSVTGVAPSGNPSAAVTRGEVDDTVSEFHNDLVNVQGDTMTGTLTVPSADISSQTNSTFKSLVFTNGWLIKSTPSALRFVHAAPAETNVLTVTSGTIQLNAPYQVRGVADPTVSHNGTNKRYVDDSRDAAIASAQGQIVESAGARAWIHCVGDGTGSVIILDSYNIAGLTRSSVGNYSVTTGSVPTNVNDIVPIVSYTQNTDGAGGRLNYKNIQMIIDNYTHNGGTATIDFQILRRTLQSVGAGFGDTSLKTQARAGVGDLKADEKMMIIFYW